MADIRDTEHYHDGFADGLDPVRSLDLSRIHSFDSLLRAYASASFGARRVGKAADVLERMVRDPSCFTVCTLTGAMTVAKMGLVLCEMIDRGFVDLVISTGALMAHGLVEATGMTHFKYDARMGDKELYDKGYNRIYDTLEMEKNLDEVDLVVRSVLQGLDPARPVSSHTICRAIGADLKARHPDQRGILKSAYEKNVPVIIPAFTDSEIGLDFAVHNKWCRRNGKVPLVFDAFADLDFYTDTVKERARLGIFTIGGGVPRNWAQQVGPYLEISAHRVPGEPAITQRFTYGVRICPEPDHLGGLSGCTYSEGTSWGKFVPEAEGGEFAEVFADATIVWPLVVKAVMERVPAKVRV